MLLGDLLGGEVRDADAGRLGTVVDMRLIAQPDDHQHVPTHVLGLVVSPRTGSSYPGYERTTVNVPQLLARILRWRHRGTFLAAWEDVAPVDMNCVTLRPGFRRYSAQLVACASPGLAIAGRGKSAVSDGQ